MSVGIHVRKDAVTLIDALSYGYLICTVLRSLDIDDTEERYTISLDHPLSILVTQTSHGYNTGPGLHFPRLCTASLKVWEVVARMTNLHVLLKTRLSPRPVHWRIATRNHVSISSPVTSRYQRSVTYLLLPLRQRLILPTRQLRPLRYTQPGILPRLIPVYIKAEIRRLRLGGSLTMILELEGMRTDGRTTDQTSLEEVAGVVGDADLVWGVGFDEFLVGGFVGVLVLDSDLVVVLED